MRSRALPPQDSVLRQQQVKGAWDVLGTEASRKQYDKDAAERKAKPAREDADSTAEVSLSGLASGDTGHISLEDLKATAAKVLAGAVRVWRLAQHRAPWLGRASSHSSTAALMFISRCGALTRLPAPADEYGPHGAA